jgi:hypothetical protein
MKMKSIFAMNDPIIKDGLNEELHEESDKILSLVFLPSQMCCLGDGINAFSREEDQD